MKEFKRILVPTDLSRFSTVAFEYAEYLAKRFHATIHVLHVIEESPVLSPYPAELAMPVVEEEAFLAAEAALKDLVSREMKHRGGVQAEVRRGNPFTEICRYATEHAIDLIVIPTHGRTGLAHVLMGSTAERVVQHAQIPVLAVKPDDLRGKSHVRKALEEVLRD